MPKLRFPEFRDAPGWEEKRLGDVCSFSKGKGISKADISPAGKTPCIRYAELYTTYNEVITDVISRTTTNASDLVLSKENDVIIPSSGETAIDIACASCVTQAGIALGGDLNIMRGEVDGIFLSYYLNNAAKLSIAKIAQGDAVVHLYGSQLSNLDVHLPSNRAEQKTIADCLSSLDELFAAQAQKLDTLKAHKKGLMQQLFPAEGETMPKLRFPEFQDAPEWAEKRLGEVLTFQAGFPFDSASFTEKCDGLRLIRNRDLKSDDKIIFYSRSFDEHFVVDDGDVLVGMDGDFTPCVWNKGKALLNQRVGRILPHKTSSQRFMYYFLTVHLKAIEEVTARTTVKHLSHSDVEKIHEPLPALLEQQKIAECLSSLDEIIDAQIQKLDTLKAHKKGLMQQLFPSADEVSG